MGSAWGRGVREGLAPLGGGKDMQSLLSEGRDNMDKGEEDWASRT
jgi:hypothetical protein